MKKKRKNKEIAKMIKAFASNPSALEQARRMQEYHRSVVNHFEVEAITNEIINSQTKK